MNPKFKKNRNKIKHKSITGEKLKAKAILLGIRTNEDMARLLSETGGKVGSCYVGRAFKGDAPGLMLRIHEFLIEYKKQKKQAA